MKSELQYLAELAIIDMKLDELHEDCGDLPLAIKKMEKKYYDLEAMVRETEQIINDVKKFKSDSKLTLQTLKDKEEKLANQQFNVRNNKEFDAITKEIESVRSEHVRITDEMRTIGVKEENLNNTLEEQKKNAEVAKVELEEKQHELDHIANDQNEDLVFLKNKKKEISQNISKHWYAEYLRIRTLHNDAVVVVKKNSCTGCYSSIPPQKNVEIRNNENKIFYCESCGRMLYPQEMYIDQEILDII
jgi:predicted  nucleic acid-binding Zn-ribbon protein